MITLKNLYLDESGRYFIGDPDYRFFLITAVILNPDETELANLLFAKWRDKYLINPDKSIHAADFFENRKGLIFGFDCANPSEF